MIFTHIQLNAFQLYDPTAILLPGQRPSPDIVRTNLFNFYLRGVDNSQSYILKGSTGLDAEDIAGPNLGFPDNGYRKFNRKPKAKPVTLLLSLNPNYNLGETPESLRSALYKAMNYSRYASTELRFMNGTDEVAHLTGQIEKFEGTSFSSEAQVQITLTPDYPFLRPSIITQSVGSAVDHGTYHDLAFTDSLSTAVHGGILIFTFKANQSDLIIAGDSTTEDEYFKINYSFLEDDILTISTEFDNKYVMIERPTWVLPFPYTPPDYFQIAHAIDATYNTWPTIYPGANSVRVYADISSEVQLNSVSWRESYWGI